MQTVKVLVQFLGHSAPVEMSEDVPSAVQAKVLFLFQQEPVEMLEETQIHRDPRGHFRAQDGQEPKG